MLNPVIHPRRHAEHVERQLAERARALAIALSVEQTAARMGISVTHAEQLGARFAFAYQPSRKVK